MNYVHSSSEEETIPRHYKGTVSLENNPRHKRDSVARKQSEALKGQCRSKNCEIGPLQDLWVSIFKYTCTASVGFGQSKTNKLSSFLNVLAFFSRA